MSLDVLVNQVRVVGGVMSATLGWDPKRRGKEEEEAFDRLRKQKEAMLKLRSGLERRVGPVTERKPALDEALKERWRAEVRDDGIAVMSHWQKVTKLKFIQKNSGRRWQCSFEPLAAGEVGQGGSAIAHRGAADEVGVCNSRLFVTVVRLFQLSICHSCL